MYEIINTFQASPDGVRVKTYAEGDVVEPTNRHEADQLRKAIERGDARAWLPKSVEERQTKVTRAPKRK